MYQRCQKHDCLPSGAFWLQKRRYGHLDRRSTKSHESAYKAKHSSCHALAGQGCQTQRLALLPLLWYAFTPFSQILRILVLTQNLGHGGQTKDLDGDEADGYDEVIYPVDFRQHGHITDDEMHRIMVHPLQAGVRLTAIFDSCHSGTALDLPYIYSTQGILKEPNLAKEAGQGLLGVISSYSQGDMGGVANNIIGFFKKATTGDDAHNRTLATKTSPADVIMWSGSKDDQTS